MTEKDTIKDTAILGIALSICFVISGFNFCNNSTQNSRLRRLESEVEQLKDYFGHEDVEIQPLYGDIDPIMQDYTDG